MEQEPSEGQVKELQAFMETENQKAVIQAAISKLTDICFEKCITKPGTPSPSRPALALALALARVALAHDERTRTPSSGTSSRSD
eukprot:scaffold120875_cov55-Phaeocystis_antarctica.AAC.3